MNTSSNVGVFYNDVTMTNCNSASEQISLSVVNGFEVAYNKSYTNGDQGPVIPDAGGAGIDSKGGSKNGTIHHNEVWDIYNGSVGIYVDAFNRETYNIQVYSNYVHDVGAAGISIGSEAGGALYDITAHHNIVERAEMGGIVFHNIGPSGNSVRDIFIYNNTLYLNGTNGTTYFGGVRIFDTMLARVTFKNNILVNAYNFQIGVSGVDPSVVTADHNVIYGAQLDVGGYTHIPGTNTILSDPLFVSTSDFHLQSGSPAKYGGDNSVWQGIPNIKDYDGVPITDTSGNIVAPGGTVSCGAYEYNEGATGFNDIDDDGFGKDNDGILIYPNPARDYLIIKNSSSKQFKLSLINILNETIISNKIIELGTLSININNCFSAY
jgi:hypothetical protein